MSRLLPLLAAAVLVLTACPRRGPTPVAGSADAEVDAIEAELEELRSRGAAGGSEACAVSGRACGLAGRACEVARAQPEREDFERVCATGQEDCARLRDACPR